MCVCVRVVPWYQSYIGMIPDTGIVIHPELADVVVTLSDLAVARQLFDTFACETKTKILARPLVPTRCTWDTCVARRHCCRV